MTEDSSSFVPPTKVAVSQRSAARFAAVQALYQLELLETNIHELIDEYINHRLGKEVDGELYADADPQWFKMIVLGVMNEQKIIDPWISNILKENWTLKRIDSTLRAILRAGTFELYKRKDVPARSVITEYMSVTNAFFEETEQHLVNGILDRMAREHRPDEFETETKTET